MSAESQNSTPDSPLDEVPRPDDVRPPDDSLRPALLRLVKIAAVLLALIMVGIGVASYMGPESSDLPLQYDGFD